MLGTKDRKEAKHRGARKKLDFRDCSPFCCIHPSSDGPHVDGRGKGVYITEWFTSL
jgi:hypothetical protein